MNTSSDGDNFMQINVTRVNNFVYLLREREFIKTGEKIYKIGKTTQSGLERFKQYPSGSELLLHIVCDDCHELERSIMDVFGKKYKRRLDVGNEYYEGEPSLMIFDIIKLSNVNINKWCVKNEKHNISITINNISLHESKTPQLKTGHKFIAELIEKTFAGQDISSLNENDYTFRFPFADLNKKFKTVHGKNIHDTLKKQLNEIGIQVKNVRAHRHGNKLTQCITLYPPAVEKAIQTYLDSNLFKFNFNVKEEKTDENLINSLKKEIEETEKLLMAQKYRLEPLINKNNPEKREV